MAVNSYVGILPARSIDLTVDGNLQEFLQVHPVVFVRNWLDVMVHRNMDTHLAGVDSQDPHQCGEEDKKDWLFEVILLALILPFICLWHICLVLGRSPFGGSGKIREGTPLPSLTHLAHIRLFIHQLL